jgi:serine/threonine protein kinase
MRERERERERITDLSNAEAETRDDGLDAGQPTLTGEGPDVVPGEVLDGKYRIDGKIAEGGMGVVWRSTHMHLQAPVAIKILMPELRKQPQAIERFWHEARIMGGLGHPNIVRVLDVSSPTAPLPYIVMELLSGESLRARMRREGKLHPADACNILDGILTALVVAHGQNIVHRDLKPENVFVIPRPDDDEGPGYSVKVLDFGASKLLDDERDPHLTRAGGLLGTPLYMSPEQAAGGAITHRSDLYSAGVLFYEMLSEHLPHDAKNLHGIILQLTTVDATPIENWMPTVGPEMRAFLGRALARDPAERFDTAETMRKHLRSVPRPTGARGQMLDDVQAEAFAAALEDVVEKSETVADDFPGQAVPEDARPRPAPAPEQLVEVAAPGANLDALPKIEIDRPAEAEAPAERGRRPLWPVPLVLVLAALPAYVVWNMRQSELVEPKLEEMARVVNNPQGVRGGSLRPPREIEPEIEEGEALSARDAGIAWAAASVLGLLGWAVFARRR